MIINNHRVKRLRFKRFSREDKSIHTGDFTYEILKPHNKRYTLFYDKDPENSHRRDIVTEGTLLHCVREANKHHREQVMQFLEPIPDNR